MNKGVDFGLGIGGLAEALSRSAPLIGLLVLSVLVLLAASALRTRRPAYRRGRFLTANEKRFLSVLDEAVGDGYRVFAQVRLADLVDVEIGASDSKRRAAMSKVFGKSIDFVICAAATLDPVAAIEVDDRTHLRPHRQERDAFVDAVFAQIGLPLLRVRAGRGYAVTTLRASLNEAGVDCRPARAGVRTMERG